MTVLDIVNRVPPWLCRYLARKNHGLVPMSHSDVAKRSGLARSTVVVISHKPDWGSTPLPTIVKFAAGCGINHLALKKHMQFWGRHKKAYLSRATPSQRRMYASLTALGNRHNGAGTNV